MCEDIRRTRALKWFREQYGRDVFEETDLEEDTSFDRYFVVAQKSDGAWTTFAACTSVSLERAAANVKAFADDGFDVDVYDTDADEIVPVQIRHEVSLG